MVNHSSSGFTRQPGVGIICYPTVGGSGTAAADLAIQLANRGFNVEVLSYELPFRLRNQLGTTLVFHEITPPEYPLFQPYPPISLVISARLVELVRDRRIQLIHSHYAVPFALASAIARDIVRDFTRVPLVTTLHGTDVTLVGQDPRLYDVVKHSMDSCDALIAVSDYLLKTTRAIFSPIVPLYRIYNFVDTRRFSVCSPAAEIAELRERGKRILLHASNFRRVKRATDLVDILARVRRRHDAVLVLVGEGPDLPLVGRRASELGLRDCLYCFPFVANIEEFYSGADVTLVPSELESFSLAALESQACGAPVVASQTGGLPEAIADGETGFLAPVGNVEAFANAVLHILDDKALQTKMSRQAVVRARDLFSADIIVPQIINLYQSLLS
ncbi:MAG: N-acetyl-alpha-D-glucosaminyl L-malate synthase BshA [bacterium JZ-2024 1]